MFEKYSLSAPKIIRHFFSKTPTLKTTTQTSRKQNWKPLLNSIISPNQNTGVHWYCARVPTGGSACLGTREYLIPPETGFSEILLNLNACGLPPLILAGIWELVMARPLRTHSGHRGRAPLKPASAGHPTTPFTSFEYPGVFTG